MLTTSLLLIANALNAPSGDLSADQPDAPTNVYEFQVETIDGEKVKLGDEYRGKVLLIVNVASAWGFTEKNYDELQQLTEKYGADKFSVLGFPCNQFGSQEPGTAEEIKEFAKSKGASFPLFSKIEVNGANVHPLYQFLKHKLPGILGTEGIKWNFTKFLIDKNGIPVMRFAPNDNPLSFKQAIIDELAKPEKKGDDKKKHEL